MPADFWPRLPDFELERSLTAAEVIATTARQLEDPGLRRLLQKSACRLLDLGLTQSMATPRPKPTTNSR